MVYMITKQKLIDYILENKIVNNNQYNYRKLNNKIHKEIILTSIDQYIEKCKGITIGEKIYWLIYGLEDYPKQCPVCGSNIIYFDRWNNPYPTTYCSIKCGSTATETTTKRKKTNLHRYGHENAGASEVIQKKIQENNLKKYGVKTTLLVKEIQDKIKETMMINYGVDHNMKSLEIRNKAKATNLERYGVGNVFESPKIQQKIRLDCLENTELIIIVNDLKL